MKEMSNLSSKISVGPMKWSYHFEEFLDGLFRKFGFNFLALQQISRSICDGGHPAACKIAQLVPKRLEQVAKVEMLGALKKTTACAGQIPITNLHER
jgi:hypothetical protein